MINKQQQTDITTGKQTVLLAVEALENLAQTLDVHFSCAVDTIAHLKGHLIITGIGKSGYIGRKIAATLASTGTRAQFIHATEASHGDLGMIHSSDGVLAISNSGETRELSDIIHYTRRHNIPLIAITAKEESTLAKAADIALVLPAHQEASRLKLAPTTSTTMALALGDALAVSLLERKNFTADDFQNFHPGGQLGQHLLKVRDIMHTREALPLVHKQSLMKDVIITMTSKHFGCAGVIDDNGELCGIVTDGDIRKNMQRGFLDKSVLDIMTKNPKTTDPSRLAASILHLLNQSKITAIFVVEAKKPVGIVHMHDFLRAKIA